VLLIDSILRQMDVPKIYLRKLPAGGLHRYEAVDGQQRLRAIWDFTQGTANEDGKVFALTTRESLPTVNGITIADKTFAQLSRGLKQRLLDFEIGVGEIVESTNDEIAVLFARLQMGMPLNPAELRNSELGPMRNMIKLVSASHEFFANTALSKARDKHFDFASYAFAVIAGGGEWDMKAADLRAFQREYNHKTMEEITKLSALVGDALNILAEVDKITAFPITRKWIFVDLLLLVSKLQAAGVAIDVDKFSAAYDAFEERRRAYTSSPENLLRRRRGAHQLDKSLYNYIYAFRTEGAKAASIQRRHASLVRFFKNVEVA
jgi:hypothetical protein